MNSTRRQDSTRERCAILSAPRRDWYCSRATCLHTALAPHELVALERVALPNIVKRNGIAAASNLVMWTSFSSGTDVRRQ